MRIFVVGLMLVLFCLSTGTPSYAQRPVQLPYPPQAIFLLPPLAVAYDLNRRINCLTPPDPLGLGGPGFDGKPTPPSNVMIPCYERRMTAGRPAPKR